MVREVRYQSDVRGQHPYVFPLEAARLVLGRLAMKKTGKLSLRRSTVRVLRTSMQPAVVGGTGFCVTAACSAICPTAACPTNTRPPALNSLRSPTFCNDWAACH